MLIKFFPVIAAGKSETILVPHMGGTVHNPEDILRAIEEAAK